MLKKINKIMWNKLECSKTYFNILRHMFHILRSNNKILDEI